MSAYYNEIDPKAAAWLRELIARGLIAPGVVDAIVAPVAQAFIEAYRSIDRTLPEAG